MTVQPDEKAMRHILRIQASHESKRTLNYKVHAIRRMEELFEDTVIEPDDWRSTYRLPELFGINERKKADLMEHMPEVVVESDMRDDTNSAVAARGALEHFQYLANFEGKKAEAIDRAVTFGCCPLFVGVTNVKRSLTPIPKKGKPQLLLPKGKEKAVSVYYGLSHEAIDLRDAFPDPAATVDHDPTGVCGMAWFYRRRIYTMDKFMEDFANEEISEYFDISEVEPVDWHGVTAYGIDRVPTKHEVEEKVSSADLPTISKKEMKKKRYVVVFEGWDELNDDHVFIANGQTIYEGALPYKHKKIPIVFYYNYKRSDSIWGISEAEINAPFILIKETLVNLMIDNAKLSQQPVVAVSGDANLDPEENELEPGALFTLQGLNGGKVRDAIQTLQFGSSVEPAMAVKNVLEDMQIQTTGDDSRSLTVSPNELATQTLAKQEALKKRVRRNVMLNTIRSEREVVNMQYSLICQYLARPYQDLDGNFKHHIVHIKNYHVAQRNRDAAPQFTPVEGFEGVFELNTDAIQHPETVRFKVVERVEDAVKKEQEMQSMQWWMQTIFSLAEAKPELMQNTDLEMLAKQAGQKFTDIDVESIFNSSSRIVDGMDEMDYYIEQIALGIQPVIEADGKNIKRLQQFRKFAKTKEFGTFKPESKRIYGETLIGIIEAIRKEKSQPFAEFAKLRGLGPAFLARQQGGVPGGPDAGGAPIPAGNAPASPGQAIQPEGQPQSGGQAVSEGTAPSV